MSKGLLVKCTCHVLSNASSTGIFDPTCVKKTGTIIRTRSGATIDNQSAEQRTGESVCGSKWWKGAPMIRSWGVCTHGTAEQIHWNWNTESIFGELIEAPQRAWSAAASEADRQLIASATRRRDTRSRPISALLVHDDRRRQPTTTTSRGLGRAGPCPSHGRGGLEEWWARLQGQGRCHATGDWGSIPTERRWLLGPTEQPKCSRLGPTWIPCQTRYFWTSKGACATHVL
jgi:hypothetical protein